MTTTKTMMKILIILTMGNMMMMIRKSSCDCNHMLQKKGLDDKYEDEASFGNIAIMTIPLNGGEEGDDEECVWRLL